MRVCFYSPYVPKHFGGGEKHFFDVATLTATKHEVFIAINENESKSFKQIKEDYEKFLNYPLDNLEFIKSPIPTGGFFKKLFWTKQFDYLYYATDGSLFFSLAKKNNLHIQIPFTDSKTSLLDRIKLKNWNIKNTNSSFTKKIIEDRWSVKIDFVHNPKVSFEEMAGNGFTGTGGKLSRKQNSKPKKEKTILNVGRFFRQLHSKRQDVLVEVFKELVSQHPKLLKGWKLVLIGSVEDKDYYKQVKEAAKGLPIELHTNVSRETLVEYYQKAKIYWHATGYEINEEVSPEKVEHFGITTIEAMAAGCIPIVLGKGGQVEVIGNDLSELLWQTKAQCIDKTIKVINGKIDNKILNKKVLNQVKKFDEKVFAEKLWRML